ncbi:SLOG family protein [Sporolactobacillus sp. CPB3-1]|uniref:SLOG family protein n=1 Tax=Sporolactobacillus mangiferae TaxID=2940498 RepID=A0ABT0MBU0_9BACL|nr:SLOG family protein [Sporolactobacillus mangiferae]MCL1631744.1 SLOG family protein [Sporolactobacillus mangiferae]
MRDQESVILITGYKAHELGVFTADHPGIQTIRYILEKKILAYVEQGALWFVISGQTGVELWAGEVCLKLRDSGQINVKLAVLMPFLNQEAHYKEWQKECYLKVLDHADYAASISNRPYEGPEQLRQKNDFLVAKTDAMLIIYDEEKKGSPVFYLNAAKRKKKQTHYPIQMINHYDLDLAADDLQQQNPDYWSNGV